LANDNRFSYYAPIIFSVDPIRGPVDGGQSINIRGTNFGINTFEIKEVLVRGVVCKNINLVNPTLITCITGASTIMGPGVGNIIIKKITGLSTPANTCNMYEYSTTETIIVPPIPIPPPPQPRPIPVPVMPVCIKPIKPAIVVKDFNIKPHKLFSFKEKEDPNREDMLNALNRHLETDYNPANLQLVEKTPPINYMTDNNFPNSRDGFRKKRFAKIIDQFK
jgi:hypothetical protein